MTDVTHELARQVVDRGEDPASDHIAFDAAEPEFDLIEPRGIGRSEMQVQLGMIGQELCDPPGLMRREVVGDDVDLATLGLQRNNLAQESHKLLGGMVCKTRYSTCRTVLDQIGAHGLNTMGLALGGAGQPPP